MSLLTSAYAGVAIRSPFQSSITYPLTREVVIVCNDEGKLLGLPITAVAISEFASAPEMIAGDFFVCRRDEENLVGLRESDLFTMGKRVYAIDRLAR